MLASSHFIVPTAFPQLLVRLALSSFGLSLGWEWGQLPAYLCPAAGHSDKLALVLPSAAGDVALTFGLVTLAWVLQREPACPLRLTGRRLLVFIVGGFGLAILIERVALAADLWSYAALMPMVPAFQVGWLPVLYTMMVPPLAAVLACPARSFPFRLPWRQ